MTHHDVPFFRPDIGQSEIEGVVSSLRSGWLTTGPLVRRFETEFAAAVRAPHAVAVTSCTAALHLAIEALGLKPGEGVLVPAMTFAATAEVVRYLGGVPVLVDCDPLTGNMDLADAERRLDARDPRRLRNLPPFSSVVGMIPVHVGGLMMDTDAVARFAVRHGLWTVEDAAHAFPAAIRCGEHDSWRQCGQGTSHVTCFSFYANKTITTGEGGMAVTASLELTDRMRLMSLHGLSHDAWGRYSGTGGWDYRIVAPGYKYNMTDVAAAIGIGQLGRAEQMRRRREEIARQYLDAFDGIEEIELPPVSANRIHAWHLFQIKLNLDRVTISRNQLIEELRRQGVSCSVHWRPLHLHPYYEESFGCRPEDYPHATALFHRTVSIPLFPSMTARDVQHVIDAVSVTVREHSAATSTRIA